MNNPNIFDGNHHLVYITYTTWKTWKLRQRALTPGAVSIPPIKVWPLLISHFYQVIHLMVPKMSPLDFLIFWWHSHQHHLEHHPRLLTIQTTQSNKPLHASKGCVRSLFSCASFWACFFCCNYTQNWLFSFKTRCIMMYRYIYIHIYTIHIDQLTGSLGLWIDQKRDRNMDKYICILLWLSLAIFRMWTNRCKDRNIEKEENLKI